MGTIIFPSHNAVGSSASDLGRGRKLNESDLAEILRALGGQENTVISGLSVTTSGLTATIAIGKAIIEGRLVVTDETIDVALPSSGTTRVLLEITRDGQSRVTGVTGSSQAHPSGSSPVPSDTICLARIQTAGGAVTQNHDARLWRSGATRSGIYTGDGEVTQDVIIGETPRLVIISGVDSKIWAMSHALDWAARNEGTGAHNFGIFSRPGITQEVPVIPTGSKAWDTGVLVPEGTGTYFQTTTVNVLGAAVGDIVAVWHDDYDHSPPANIGVVVLYGSVTSANTVTVTAKNIHPSQNGQLDGTLKVALLGKTTTIPVPVQFEDGSVAAYRPRIVAGGFRVQGPTDGLNQNSDRYSYVAIM